MRTIDYGDRVIELSEAEYLEYIIRNMQALYNIAGGIFAKSHPSCGFFLHLNMWERSRHYDPALRRALEAFDLIEDKELRQRSSVLVEAVKKVEDLYDEYQVVIAEFLNYPLADDKESRRKFRDKMNRYARKYGPAWVDTPAYRELWRLTDEAWIATDKAKQAIEERLKALVKGLQD